MPSENQSRLESLSRDARLRSENKFGVESPAENYPDRRKLVYLFSEMVSSRDNMIEKFSELLSLRLRCYESLLSGYIDYYYASRISDNVAVVDSLFRVLEEISSQEFSNNFDSAVYLKENSYSQEKIDAIANYFLSKFEQVASIAFPSSEITFVYESATESWKIKRDGVTVNYANETNKIYLVLYVLASLSRIAEQTLRDEISSYKSYIVDPVSGGFDSIIRANISSRSRVISDLINSKKYMDAYRATNDRSYEKELDGLVTSVFQDLLSKIEVFTDIRGSNVKSIRDDGTYNSLIALSAEALSKSDDLIRESLKAISDLEKFVENYQPFIRLPSGEAAALDRSIQVAEAAASEFPNYQENLKITTFSTPMARNMAFRSWTAIATSGRELNGSPFQMALLYIGTEGRYFLKGETAKLISNYATQNLLSKRMFSSKIMKTSFYTAISDMRNLADENGLIVSDRPQDEPSPFFLVGSLPGLDHIGYITFEEALNFRAGESNPAEENLRKNMKLWILESIGRISKSELSNSLSRAINVASNSKLTTLKELYSMICFTEAIQVVAEFLADNNSPYIAEDVLQEIEAYNSSSDLRLAEMESLLSRYNVCKLAIYASGETTDLIDELLLDGELKTFILG